MYKYFIEYFIFHRILFDFLFYILLPPSIHFHTATLVEILMTKKQYEMIRYSIDVDIVHHCYHICAKTGRQSNDTA